MGLAQEEGELVQQWKGFRSGSGRGRFFLDRILESWGPLWLPGLKLLPGGERGHGIDSKDLPGDKVLRTQILREIAEQLLYSRPFFKLVLDNGLEIFCLLFYHRLIQVPL